jgi:hypothetical protein
MPGLRRETVAPPCKKKPPRGMTSCQNDVSIVFWIASFGRDKTVLNLVGHLFLEQIVWRVKSHQSTCRPLKWRDLQQLYRPMFQPVHGRLPMALISHMIMFVGTPR